MHLRRPYTECDDEQLGDACIRGDLDAWSALLDRHGLLAEVVMLRELDGPAHGARYEPAPLHEALREQLARHDAAALRAWSPRDCSMRALLATIARHAVRRRDDATPTQGTPLVAFFPTPPSMHVGDAEAEARAVPVHELLERLPPTLAALVRLRLRGVEPTGIAASVGLAQGTVALHLEKVAARIAELDAEGVGKAPLTDAYRLLLGAADVAERSRAALRTEDEPGFRRARSLAEATWRSVRNRVLGEPTSRGPLCLDDRGVAGFVDGTMRGAQRARSEGHVGSCPRCLDDVATLASDLRAVPILRDSAGLPRELALAATCLATTRFAAAGRLAAARNVRNDERSVRVAIELARLAAAAVHLEAGRPRGADASGLVARGLPTDDEAPRVAFEALSLGDTYSAYRAIDEHTAKAPLCARLRLLAAAAGEDVARARNWAEEAAFGPRIDPGFALDAEAILALPEARELPREMVVERLRDLLPQVVRAALAR